MTYETFTKKEAALASDILYTAGWPLLAQKTVRAYEKQIQKPLRHRYETGIGICDKCGGRVLTTDNYCAGCGQKIEVMP